MKHLSVLLALHFAVGIVGATEADQPLDLVRRALPFVRERGLDWIENRDCASCHQVPSMLWSMNRAAVAGITVDGVETAELTNWATDWRHWNQSGEKEGETKVSAANIDTMAFLLLGRDTKDDSPRDWVARFRDLILINQQSDGSWKAGGQLPLGKRPARETNEVTTMWTLLALDEGGADPVPAKTLASAESFLSAAKPGLSTEWHALRLLRSPKDGERLKALLDLQREDGGWGWLATDPADALGTGFALFALARAGLPENHEARQRAIRFLEKTQSEDGSWAVPSTRLKDANKITATATDWGTAWACIGLMETRAGAKD